MEFRPMEINFLSATDIKNVNHFTKMDVYAVVSIIGDPYNDQKQKTHVHKDCGTEPKWDCRMKFTINELSLKQNRLTLKIQLKSDRTLGDKEIGEVTVPIKEPFDQIGPDGGSKSNNKVSYSIRTASGKTKGTLHFSFNFGDKYSTPVAASTPTPPMMEKKNVDEPMMAYPATAYPVPPGAASSSGAPYYPPPPNHDGKGQPQQAYPYPYAHPNVYPGAAPPPPYYGGHPGAAPGYGYPGYQQPGYGGYGNVKPKKSGGMGKLGLGLGAGLLGGLLVGDMISDVGEVAAYDAGYDDGFDAGGFDF